MAEDIATYLDGTDPAAVAAAARRLDREAYRNHQISYADLQRTLAQSDEEIVAERDAARDADHLGRQLRGLAALVAIRDILG